MFHPTFLSQKVRIQLVRIHIIVCEAKARTVEVLCKNNTPLLHRCWQCFLEPRNEPKITFAPKILLCCHVISHMRTRYSALSAAAMLEEWNILLGTELYSYANSSFCFIMQIWLLVTWANTLYWRESVWNRSARSDRIRRFVRREPREGKNCKEEKRWPKRWNEGET